MLNVIIALLFIFIISLVLYARIQKKEISYLKDRKKYFEGKIDDKEQVIGDKYDKINDLKAEIQKINSEKDYLIDKCIELSKNTSEKDFLKIVNLTYSDALRRILIRKRLKQKEGKA